MRSAVFSTWEHEFKYNSEATLWCPELRITWSSRQQVYLGRTVGHRRHLSSLPMQITGKYRLEVQASRSASVRKKLPHAHGGDKRTWIKAHVYYRKQQRNPGESHVAFKQKIRLSTERILTSIHSSSSSQPNAYWHPYTVAVVVNRTHNDIHTQ